MKKIRALMKIIVLVLCQCLFLTMNTSSASEVRHLVLVANLRSTVAPLSSLEIHKLFLGVPMMNGDQRITPLRNETDSLLYEVFLQKIVYMSGPNYERQLLSQVYRLGGQRPPSFDDLPALIKALEINPQAVTYMWITTVQNIADIRVVQELWQGTAE